MCVMVETRTASTSAGEPPRTWSFETSRASTQQGRSEWAHDELVVDVEIERHAGVPRETRHVHYLPRMQPSMWFRQDADPRPLMRMAREGMSRKGCITQWYATMHSMQTLIG